MDQDKPKKIKLDPLIIRDLGSDDEKKVLKALHLLRSGGSIHYIPELLRLMENSGKENVEKELVRFLADIKDPAAKIYIVRGLKSDELTNARGNIISACWQSGLDYSDELELFLEIFFESDYRTAIECFTVIEESAINLDAEKLQALRQMAISKMKDLGEEKKPLASELIKVLNPDYSGFQD